MSTLSFKNINKVYDNNVQAVFDFNLDIKDKELIVLVGPSGCGKSTTLRMVAGLETITVGELYIDNVLVNNVESKDRNIAMVFQNYALYPHMTVYGNMAFTLQLRKVPCPIYEAVPEAEELKLQTMELIKRVKVLRKLAKKKNESKKIAEEISCLHDQIIHNNDAIQSLLAGRQIYGIYQEKIVEIQSQIDFTKKEIAYFTKAKNRGGYHEVSTKIIEEGLKQRTSQLQVFEEQLAHYQTTEVPLFKNRKLTDYEIEIEIVKAAKILDLEKYLLRKPAALSGGQRQRVALGRCIVRNPKVFLMDEPLSNLDAKLRVQTRSEIINIHKKVNATTIYVTHDQTEAMTMADRIVVMKDGYIQQIGDPDSIYTDPTNMFVAGFIGNPAMNLLTATFNGKSLVFDGQTSIELSREQCGLLQAYKGKEIGIGIRPEAIFRNGDIHLEKEHVTLPIRVDFKELLGYERVVYTTIGKQKLLAKLDRNQIFEIGETIEVGFNQSALYFFDKETTKRIK